MIVIYLGRRLLAASSSLPESHTGSDKSVPVETSCFLFGLALGRVYLANRVTSAAGALLPHRFTLAARRSGVGGLFSVALSLTRNRGPVGVTHHRVLSCSDFPPRMQALGAVALSRP